FKCDWSSDVCSSDLVGSAGNNSAANATGGGGAPTGAGSGHASGAGGHDGGPGGGGSSGTGFDFDSGSGDGGMCTGAVTCAQAGRSEERRVGNRVQVG